MKKPLVIFLCCILLATSVWTMLRVRRSCRWHPPESERDAECVVAPQESWYFDAATRSCMRLPLFPFVCSRGPFESLPTCADTCDVVITDDQRIASSAVSVPSISQPYAPSSSNDGAADGALCGGIMGIKCAPGFQCMYRVPHPGSDEDGVCGRKS